MRTGTKKFTPASCISGAYTKGEYIPDSLIESRFYRQMAADLNRFNIDLVSDNPLETIYNNITHLNNIFRLLRRPRGMETAQIQKACAYYLAHAKLSGQESDTVIDALNGYVSSTCYLTEWYDFICQMQHYLCQQEKELKQLFKCPTGKVAALQQPQTSETTYCMTVGESEIYGVTYEQLEELYKVMELFIEREKAPFECKTKEYDEYPICVGKNINFGMRGDDFFVEYGLDTFESNLSCMSAGQMKRVAHTILEFLEVYGENGNREIHWDITDCSSREPDEEVYFNIMEDSRKSHFLTMPYVQKCIEKEEEQDVEICFNIDVNEMLSQNLSYCDFIDVHRKLRVFLNQSRRA